MKLTKNRLKEIIKEELTNILGEARVLERSGAPWNERFYRSGDPDDETSFGSLASAKVFSSPAVAQKVAAQSGFSLSVKEKSKLDENLDPARREKYIRKAIAKWMDKKGRQPNQHELGDLRYEFGELFDTALESDWSTDEDELLGTEVELSPGPRGPRLPTKHPDYDPNWRKKARRQ